MEKKKEESALSVLMRYAGGHKYCTYFSWVFSGLSAIAALLTYVFLFRIIKEVIEAAPNFKEAIHIASNGWFAVLAAAVSMLLYFAALMCSHASAFRVATNIRKELLAYIAKLPIGFADELGSGRIRRIINDSAATTEVYLAHQLPDLVGAYITPVAMILLLFVFNWRFGLVCLIPVVLSLAGMTKMTGKQMQEDMKHYQTALENMNNEAVEYVRGINVVKTFSQTVHSFSRFKASIDSYYKFCINYTKEMRMPMVCYQMIVNSTFAFLIALTLILYRGDHVAFNILLNFVFYVIFTPVIATTLTKIMFMGEEFMKVEDAIARFNEIMAIEPLPEPAQTKHPQEYAICFDDVSFRYRKELPDAVSHISLQIPVGKVTAFVGPSGSGKSTAAGLIARFYDATSGQVRIGDVDIRDIAQEERVGTISYVFQNSRLLAGTIADNVRMGKKNATDEEVLAALHKAQCDDILAKLPQGIETVIGTDGIYLSGGEQQRIAIARIILQDAPVIILDEATAYADPENEVLVQKAFEEMAVGKTVIMIAHRLTTVKNADTIYVFENGKIKEAGKHEALLEANGLYGKMWNDYQTSIRWKVGGSK